MDRSSSRCHRCGRGRRRGRIDREHAEGLVAAMSVVHLIGSDSHCCPSRSCSNHSRHSHRSGSARLPHRQRSQATPSAATQRGVGTPRAASLGLTSSCPGLRGAGRSLGTGRRFNLTSVIVIHTVASGHGDCMCCKLHIRRRAYSMARRVISVRRRAHVAQVGLAPWRCTDDFPSRNPRPRDAGVRLCRLRAGRHPRQ